MFHNLLNPLQDPQGGRRPSKTAALASSAAGKLAGGVVGTEPALPTIEASGGRTQSQQLKYMSNSTGWVDMRKRVTSWVFRVM